MKNLIWILACFLFCFGLAFAGQSSVPSKIVWLRYDNKYENTDAWVADLGEGPYPQYDMNTWQGGPLELPNQRQITSSGNVICAKWLGENTVAVVSNQDIWLIHLDSQGIKTQLTSIRDVDKLACTHDGKWIIFTRIIDRLGELGIKNHYQLWKVRPDGTSLSLVEDVYDYTLIRDLICVQDKIFYVQYARRPVEEGTDEEYDEHKIKKMGIQGGNSEIIFRSNEDIEIYCLAESWNKNRLIFAERVYFSRKQEHREYFREIDFSGGSLRTIFNLGPNAMTISQIIMGCAFIPNKKLLFSIIRRGGNLILLDLEKSKDGMRIIGGGFSPDVWFPR